MKSTIGTNYDTHMVILQGDRKESMTYDDSTPSHSSRPPKLRMLAAAGAAPQIQDTGTMAVGLGEAVKDPVKLCHRKQTLLVRVTGRH